MFFSGYPAVTFLWWFTYIIRSFSSLELFPQEVRWDPPLRYLKFSFILAYVRCPSSTCRVDFFRIDICPVSLIPKWLEMVNKA